MTHDVGRRGGARIGLAAILAVGLLASVPARAADPVYRDGDESVTALNILPPGQGEHLNAAELALAQALGMQPDHNTNQLAMYESLVAAVKDPITADAVSALFKDASFGVAPGDVARTYFPRPGLTVIRDDPYNVPHVYGVSRADTMFGAGYVSAEDRMFMMDVLRHLGRGRVTELLGASEANLAMDRAQRLGADYTEEELYAMGQRLLGLDPVLGYLAYQDLVAFTDGVNAYIQEMIADPTKLPAEYAALQIVPKPWKLTDSIAEATLIGATFSTGGGGQLANDRFLDALEDEITPTAAARAVFDDFRNAEDPEAPTTTTDPFPLNHPVPPVDPAAVARPDDPAAMAVAVAATALPPEIDGPFGKIRLAASGGASNAVLISAATSATGLPLALMGPQVGYFSPEILNEIDLHGPGVHARGAAFPGISLYALLGRGAGYAWSATTAVGDHRDIRAERLCEPGGTETTDSDHYLVGSLCLPMYTRTDTWVAKPSAGGVPAPDADGDEVVVSMTTERTHHGIVVARGTVGGDPVAFVRERSSYGREVDATLTFVTVHDPARVQDMDDLQHAFGDWFSYSFNWHLIDGSSIGFITTGRYPLLAPGVDPDLPFWGDATWDWQGFLPYAGLPKDLDPPEGFITNWNNKQAPGFRAADDNYSYGSVQRKQMLTAQLQSALSDDGKISIPELVRAMGLAATQDLRGTHVLPFMLQVIGDPSVGTTAEQQAALTTLASWAASGAHRRDTNNDGMYEDAPAVALMDAWWTPALKAAFQPVLGEAFDDVPMGHHGAPGAGGSAFFGGWYPYMHKDLRSVLGEPVAGPYSREYCGGGVLAECRAALLAALDEALAVVAAKHAADPNWAKTQKSAEMINFSAVGVQDQRNMHWQNRPTFQQLLEFEP